MATSTPASLQGMVAVSAGKGIKVLGYLCWFSIPDESVTIRRFKRNLALQGLPTSLAPSDAKAINVFKRAMREQEGRQVNGAITETTVALVNETPADCVYQITRLVRDLNEREIDYPKAMRVRFDKRTEKIEFNRLGGVPSSDLMPMMEAITDFYESNAKRISGARVRSTIRNYLRSTPDEVRSIDGLSGENLRGKAGGVYFIPAKHIEQITALSQMLDELYKDGRAYLHAVPMADSASEREMIRRHHVSNTQSDLRAAMVDAKRLLDPERDRAPRSDVVAEHWARCRAIQRRAAEYTALLQDEAEEVDTMLSTLRGQLDRLSD